jgi:hypothetical protein
MCANYDPSKEIDFEAFSEFPRPKFDYPPETWKDYVAPILRIDGTERLTDPATFGMVPRKHIPTGVKRRKVVRKVYQSRPFFCFRDAAQRNLLVCTES